MAKKNMKQISIILMNPQMGENIGFVARSMLNFDLQDLRIVAPRDPWPNAQAVATAVKGEVILDKAMICQNLLEATKDLDFLYVTTARRRDLNKPYVSSADLKNDISKLSSGGFKKIGIIFGPERSGVDNTTVSLAHKIISIPVGKNFPSLNLAMAASIICYEASQANFSHEEKKQQYATQEDVHNLLEQLDNFLEKSKIYQVPEKKKTMQHNINCIFQRIQGLTYNETQTLIGVFSHLSKNIKD